MSASYLAVFATKAAWSSASYRMRSHAPPAAMTPLAIGIESMRLPSGPLSEPPFLAPGTLNWTTQSLYAASGGDGRRMSKRFAPPFTVAFPFAGAGVAALAGFWLAKSSVVAVEAPQPILQRI